MTVADTSRPSVVMTGAGMICAAGNSVDDTWDALVHGRQRFAPVSRDLGGRTRTWLAGVAETPSGMGDVSRATAFALAAADEAVRQAGLLDGSIDRGDIGVVVGTCLGPMFEEEVDDAPSAIRAALDVDEITDAIAAQLGATGPGATVTSACASGANAIVLATEWLLEGRVRVVIAGGADELCAPTFVGFGSVGALVSEPNSPYGKSEGITPGEGAAFVVLERFDDAIQRGAVPLIEIAGSGLSSDAFHPTAPDSSGGGAVLAVVRALADAGLGPGDIDHVNSHGTGTPTNDSVEPLVFDQSLEAGGAPIPITATKSMTGHALGATAAMEVVFAAEAVRRSFVPGTMGTSSRTLENTSLRIVGDGGEAYEISNALSASYAFGGMNSCVVVSKPGPLRPARAHQSAPITISGIGPIGALGYGIDEWCRSLQSSGGPPALPFVEMDKRVENQPRRWRRLGALSKRAIAAAELAVAHAALTDVDVDGVAVLVASSFGPLDVAIEFEQALLTKGRSPNPRLFPNSALSSTAGNVAETFGWRGPICTFVGSHSPAVGALGHARHLLERDSVQAVVIVALDLVIDPLPSLLVDRDPDARPGASGSSDAAVGLVVERCSDAANRGAAGLRVAGTGIVSGVFPEQRAAAAVRALEAAASRDGRCRPDLVLAGGTCRYVSAASTTGDRDMEVLRPSDLAGSAFAADPFVSLAFAEIVRSEQAAVLGALGATWSEPRLPAAMAILSGQHRSVSALTVDLSA
jgi:3-oxoacyl-[acyl-carrier-protein] synthase II